jgi:peptidyl-prolyl cis-trans isomerase D
VLQYFRRKTFTKNLILILIIAALASYVLVAFGSGQTWKATGDTVAKMGSIPIKVKDLQISERSYRDRFRDLDEAFLNNLIVNSVVSNSVLKKISTDMGLHVSETELKDTIIRMRQGYSEEGAFVSSEAWANWINYNYQMTVSSFETYLKENDLKTQKLRNIFMTAPIVTEAELLKAFTRQNSRLDLEYLTLNQGQYKNKLDTSDETLAKALADDPEAFQTGPQRKIAYVLLATNDFLEEIAVTPEEVKEFYEERKDKPPYKQETRVRAKHILIKPVDGDKEAALAKTKKVREEIVQGLSFEDAAKKYSEDKANADKGGDLGFQTKDRWDPAFAEVAFSLEKGQLSEPVESSFGFHLIKVENRIEAVNQTLEEASEQITSILKNRKSRDYVRDKANAFTEKAKVADSFQTVADEAGYTVSTSDFFDDDPAAEIDATLKRNRSLTQKVFELTTIGQVTDPIDIGRGFVVAKYLENASGRPLELEKDKARVVQIVENQQSVVYLEGLCSDVRAKAQSEPQASLTELLSGYDFVREGAVQASDGVSQDLPQALQVGGLTFDQLFAFAQGEIVGPIEGRFPNQSLVIRIKTKHAPDESQFDAAKEELRQSIRQQKGSELLNTFAFSVRQELDPEGLVNGTIMQLLEQ